MMGSSVVARGCCYGALSAAAVAASAAAESVAFRTSFSFARQLPLVRRIGVVNGSYRKRMRCCGTKMEPDVPSMTATATTTMAESKVTKTFGPKFSFCPACGGPTEQRIPTGEHEPRAVCTLCGFVHYQNPKMVVGCLVEHEGKVLLCRRSIQPSLGLWTLPAGYMELGESAAEGAVRETLEEAQAQVQPVSLFAHLDIPFIGQSYIIFRARFKQHPHFSPGPESLECALFDLDQIPFDQIAFSSINVALKLYAQDYTNGHFKVHCGVIEKRPGASPSDPQGFILRDYLST